MFQPRILFWLWLWFWSHSRKKNTIGWGVLLSLSLFICRFSSIGKTVYNHVYVFSNTFCAIVSLLINYIGPNILFTKYHQDIKTTHTCLSRLFLKQVHGLSNRCAFALENGLAGRFIYRYWVSLIGFGLRHSRKLVWHLSTQVNNGLLAV